jgi:hypothetical protein
MQGRELANEERGAPVAFEVGRAIHRRRAPDGCCDIDIGQTETIIGAYRRWLVREVGRVERSEQEVTRPITSKGAARPVAAMGGWGQAQNEYACFWVAEAG